MPVDSNPFGSNSKPHFIHSNIFPMSSNESETDESRVGKGFYLPTHFSMTLYLAFFMQVDYSCDLSVSGIKKDINDFKT